MHTYRFCKMVGIFSPEHVRRIRTSIDEIEALRHEIQTTLANDPKLITQAYKIDPIHYAAQFPKHIPVDTASKIEALNSFNLQVTDTDGERTPRRTFGVIQVGIAAYDKVTDLADLHNNKILQLKEWLSENFETSHSRSRHIHAAYPGIIIATLYRHIKVASDTCYSISYDWNNNQRVPTKISLEAIGTLVESLGDVYEDGSVSLTAQEAGEQIMYQLGNAPAGYEYIQLKNSKVHPQQIYYHRTPNENRKPYRGREGVYRDTIKANNCLIAPIHDGMSLKHHPPADFRHKEKKGVSVHYKPVREGLGIYLRKKIK